MQEFSSHIFAECLLALFCLTCATAKSYGPCAAVRCGFNTRCIEFNGSAKCYDTTCPTGEVFSECSSYCEPTCIPSDIACIQVCGPPACQCQPSFLRDNGKCVDPKLCSNKKVTTQSYVDEPITPSTSSCSPPCKPGFHCDDKTCVADEMKIPRCAEVRVKCQAGHHCEDTPTGITCAPDPICPANEVFNICASDCEQTCVPMGRPCTLNCLPPKCQCKDGYVREGGRCIDPKKCPNRKQSTDRIHESVMQSYVDEPITPVPLNCQSATIQILCVEGFHCEIANGAPTCVPNRRVAPKRGSQPSVTCATTLMLCRDGTHCEDINGKPKCVKDRGVSTDMPCKNVVCPSGQHCEFYRGVAQCTKSPGPCAAAFCAGGECIEYDNTFGCFNTKCGPNEEFRRCASCEPTCGPIVPCLPVCFPPACQCIGGYVRDNGKCIERNKCKKQSETNGKPTSTITNSFPCAKVKCPPGQYCEFYEGATMCVPLPGPCASVRCAGTECIEYNDTFGCFNTTCGPNEEFKRCASCEPTCGPIVPCLDVCQPPTCQCKGGYVRSKGMCIKQSSCEKSGEHGNNPYHR
ncbi:hypothetical protein RB195_015538 [Necator americanus]|uniref:Follistatin-like domain-containing protein n=1 Tax=Necator americanus TaxID=51031 RepID=A0ABR1E561_NECAM